ncbi:MAG: type II toxin-antitoxin system HicA family toxin [bacterium]
MKGNHHIMIKEGKRAVPIPAHAKRDIPKGLTSKIIKEAGIRL